MLQTLFRKFVLRKFIELFVIFLGLIKVSRLLLEDRISVIVG